ncbi:GGDEF domain-containing protein [Parendozoicomonas haliclonae]|nr:GGDEF domain-containing protein [Parendozoicomonas haliclonae]
MALVSCYVIAIILEMVLLAIHSFAGDKEIITLMVSCLGITTFCMTHFLITRKHTFSSITMALSLSCIAVYGLLVNHAFLGSTIWMLFISPIVIFSMGLKWGLPVMIAILVVACLSIFNVTNSVAGVYNVLGRIREIFAFGGSIALSSAAYYIWEQTYDRMRLLTDQLENQAGCDPLTGLANRRLMYQQMERERSRALRTNQPYTILIADLDHFKLINDTYGHPGGDAALVMISNLFNRHLRRKDFIARWGGEEFLIMLGSTKSKDAKDVAERIRTVLSKTPVKYGEHSFTVTVSVGIHTTDMQTTLEQEIALADECLYQAKMRGRNQTVSSQTPPPQDAIPTAV